MPVFVKAHRTRKGSFVRSYSRAGKAGAGGSVLKELKGLRQRVTKAIPDSERHAAGKRIKQLESALFKKKDRARVFKLKASFKLR